VTHIASGFTLAWQTLAQIDDFAVHTRKLCDAAGWRVAIFRRGDGFVAIDNRCPHRGGPVGAGPLEGDRLTCPWHGLTFDLPTGQCTEQPSQCLTQLPLRVVDGQIQVDLNPPAVRDERIFRYLVRYGVPGHVGRFGSVQRIAVCRGDWVLLATDRGQELGLVLVSADDYDPSDARPPAGELLRVASPEELQRDAALEQLRSAAIEHLATLLPSLILLDCELTFDRQTLILYHPSEATMALGPVAAKLAEVLNVPRVQFETYGVDTSRKVAAAAARTATPDDQDTRSMQATEREMRGPYERLKYDFRRVWECPVCHHRERTSGAVTSCFCPCQAKEDPLKQQPMKLVDDGPRRADGKPLPKRPSSLPS
jgi:nitrite reductase/ring-hydroxylating ferredoxin subunit